jgi:hypothetical protein
VRVVRCLDSAEHLAVACVMLCTTKYVYDGSAGSQDRHKCFSTTGSSGWVSDDDQHAAYIFKCGFPLSGGRKLFGGGRGLATLLGGR